MKRHRECDVQHPPPADGSGDARGQADPTDSSRPSKVACCCPGIDRIETRRFASFIATTVDDLTDDALYHLFNGTDAQSNPIFPLECRWVPALVCRRWRRVVMSLTRVDNQRIAKQLREPISGTLVCTNTLHTVVRASGMVLMIRLGLDPGAIGKWTDRPVPRLDVAAVLMASGMPNHRHLAVSMAKDAPATYQWSNYIDKLGFRTGCYGGTAACLPSRLYRHVLCAVAGVWWSDIGALIAMLQGRDPCCILTCALHAARRDRVVAVRALLDALPPDEYGNMRTIYNGIEPMWLVVGRYGALSVAAFLLDLEHGRISSPCYSESERRSLGCARRGSNHDGWNWLGEAAQHNRIECLDFCKECHRQFGDGGGPTDVTVAAALFQGNMQFYSRVKDSATSLTTAITQGIWWALPMQSRALVEIVNQQHLEPFSGGDTWLLDNLFLYAYEMGVDDMGIVRAAAVAARRWPNVWKRHKKRCTRKRATSFSLAAVDVWRRATQSAFKEDAFGARCLVPTDDPLEGDIKAFLHHQREQDDLATQREKAKGRKQRKGNCC